MVSGQTCIDTFDLGNGKCLDSWKYPHLNRTISEAVRDIENEQLARNEQKIFHNLKLSKATHQTVISSYVSLNGTGAYLILMKTDFNYTPLKKFNTMFVGSDSIEQV